ncbi:hypothetical protein SAMN05421753_10183 [Planctomicrobium piriforme]|uniref:Uncharacterized protein n=2 Tax=Planctomicrobium piriforme TaxID=1576369 RepID=A0A1I3AXR2_9PLAN|nr:hypothetical protein SAMN05421753_10183 [Planctomicrobium piriforme]
MVYQYIKDPRENEFLVQIGRTNQGDFIQLIHQPSGKERHIVGTKGRNVHKWQRQMMLEILAELDADKA